MAPSEPDMLHALQKNLQNEGKERFERASALYTALTGRPFFHAEDPALDLFTLLVVAQMISNEDHKKELGEITQRAVRKELNQDKDESPFRLAFFIVAGIGLFNLCVSVFCFYKII